MARGKLLDLKEKPEKTPPLIEITGPVDIGKTTIAQLVAKRLKATFISFPVLDPSTITGRGLLASLASTPKALENHPHWWAHIYAANLYEQKNKIEEALSNGPVVVTNYTIAFRLWMNALSINTDGFVTDLPSPNASFLLYGDPIAPTTRPKFDFSPELLIRIRRGLFSSNDIRNRKVILSDFYSPFIHSHVNNVCTAITANLKDRFGCKVQEKELYHPDFFLKKKDM